MGADVDQRTAALLGLVRENAPRRNAAAAQVCSLCVVDVAQPAVFDDLLRDLVLRKVAVLVADRQHLAGSVSRLEHLLRVRLGRSHRLLAENVLAGLERSDRDLAVRDVRGQNMDGVDRRVSQKLLVVGVDLRVRGAVFLRGLFGSLKNEIAECAHIDAFLLRHAREMLAVGDAAAADKADSQICHWISPPNS